jgi:transcriptional regulator with XRE-family HTH domain
MLFAEKLRQFREAAGLSEARLATASGLKFSLIHEYGLGRRRNPSFAAMIKIARALEVPLAEFAACEDFVGDEPLPATKSPRGRPPKARTSTLPTAGLAAAKKKPRGRSRKGK